MKRDSVFAVVVGCLLLSLAMSSLARAAEKPRPVVVGRDATGDWGTNIDRKLSPVGDLLGQDLVAVALGMADATTVNFIIRVKSLPPWGGWPETTRYVWSFGVGRKQWVLIGKFTDYTTGVCNPLYAGQDCPPPRDPGMSPFKLLTECKEQDPVGSMSICQTERALIHASFDAASGTITVPVPLKALDTRPGAGIAPPTLINDAWGGGVIAVPEVMSPTSAFPYDTLDVTKTFVIPGGRGR